MSVTLLLRLCAGLLRLVLRVLLAALSCVTLKVLVCVVFVCLFVAISAPILALHNI